MQGWISQEIVFYGTSDIYLKILEEHYNLPTDTYDYTTAYIKHIIITPNIIKPPQTRVPKNIFQERWSNMK